MILLNLMNIGLIIRSCRTTPFVSGALHCSQEEICSGHVNIVVFFCSSFLRQEEHLCGNLNLKCRIARGKSMRFPHKALRRPLHWLAQLLKLFQVYMPLACLYQIYTMVHILDQYARGLCSALGTDKIVSLLNHDDCFATILDCTHNPLVGGSRKGRGIGIHGHSKEAE